MPVPALMDDELDLLTCDLTINENFVAFALEVYGEKWQKPFSEQLGVSQSLLSQIKNGHIAIKRKMQIELNKLDRAEMLNNKITTHTAPNRHVHFPPMVNQARRAYVTAPIAPAIIKAEIEERFGDCFAIVESVIAGTVPSVIISGEPGIGKSYGVDKLIKESGVIHYFIKGPCSNINLYKALYAMKDGGIVVLDDSDGVFRDEDTLNTLKHATDSTETRVISYEKRLTEIEDGTFPPRFEFNGGMIFISNKDFRAEIDRGTKDAVHLSALLDRAYYIDLGIRTHAEKMVRLRQGVFEFNMLHQFKITEEAAGNEILEFIDSRSKNFPEISFRLLQAVGRLYMTNPTSWQRLSIATKGRR